MFSMIDKAIPECVYFTNFNYKHVERGSKMTNTILILGANTLQLPLIKKANNLGYDTLVVSPVVTEPGHKIAKY